MGHHFTFQSGNGMGRFKVTLPGLIALGVFTLLSQVLQAQQLRISTFSEQITIPPGHRCMGILPTRAVDVTDDLEARGIVILGAESPVVLVSLDWCEVRNESFDLWRDSLAAAAGTDRQHVLLSCIHQHDAPVTDDGAQRYLDEAGMPPHALFDTQFQRDCIERVSMALRDSLQSRQVITHVATGAAPVEGVASSRRVVHPDGRVDYDRYSSSAGNEFMRNAADGPIDPMVRVVSFHAGDKVIASMFSYATHPMSSYGKGHVSADFPGVARRLLAENPSVGFCVYFSGCSGDVTAGKYNDGSASMRGILGERLATGMQAACHNARKEQVTSGSLQFRCESLSLPFIEDQEFHRDELLKELASEDADEGKRILAAMALSTRDRIEAKQPIDVPCVEIGSAVILLLPGESFVGYQLDAQAMRPDRFVMCFGYGECWPGYVPTRQAFDENFSHGWRWVSPDAPEEMQRCLRKLLAAE
ncbi:MAG: hypothetical protein KDA96_21985 [Planctomycetaceae bacterium]|nr:hypothetical protein [Planctomycetaceae bacterium]